MTSIKCDELIIDIVPFKFSVLLRFVVFLETSLESVHEKRAQIEVESPEGKKKKKRKPNERRNQAAPKTINPEENGDKIPQGEGLTPPPRGGGTPYNGLYGEALPGRGTFFRLQVYQRVGISQV